MPANDKESVARRRHAFNQARASFALDGLTVDEDSLALMERVVEGSLSDEEALKEMRRLHGLAP